MSGKEEKTYENVNLKPDVGFDIRFVTMKHNSPFHWHRVAGASLYPKRACNGAYGRRTL